MPTSHTNPTYKWAHFHHTNVHTVSLFFLTFVPITLVNYIHLTSAHINNYTHFTSADI